MGRCPLAPSLGRPGDAAARKASTLAAAGTGPAAIALRPPWGATGTPSASSAWGLASPQPMATQPRHHSISAPNLAEWSGSAKAKHRGLLSQSMGCRRRAHCQQHPHAEGGGGGGWDSTAGGGGLRPHWAAFHSSRAQSGLAAVTAMGPAAVPALVDWAATRGTGQRCYWGASHEQPQL